MDGFTRIYITGSHSISPKIQDVQRFRESSGSRPVFFLPSVRFKDIGGSVCIHFLFKPDDMHVDPAARIVYHALADFILGILVALRFYAQRGRRARSAAMIAGNALAILAWICMVVSLVAFTIEDIAIIKWEKEGANLLDHPYSRKNIKMVIQSCEHN